MLDGDPDLLVEEDAGLDACAPLVLWREGGWVAAPVIVTGEGEHLEAVGIAHVSRVHLLRVWAEHTSWVVHAPVELGSDCWGYPCSIHNF